MNTSHEPEVVAANIESLVSGLSSSKAIERQQARHALVAEGPAAVSAVTKLADSTHDHVRWECAKTLAAIADPSSTDTLIRLLEDSAAGTRWDAAAGLVAVGKPAVTPLLKAIIDRAVHFTIIAGAHHVVHEFTRTDWGTCLRPLYEALSKQEPAASAPVAAVKVLEKWEYANLDR